MRPHIRLISHKIFQELIFFYFFFPGNFLLLTALLKLSLASNVLYKT